MQTGQHYIETGNLLVQTTEGQISFGFLPVKIMQGSGPEALRCFKLTRAFNRMHFSVAN